MSLQWGLLTVGLKVEGECEDGEPYPQLYGVPLTHALSLMLQHVLHLNMKRALALSPFFFWEKYRD